MPPIQLEPTHMLREILSQPECWSECIRQLENDAVLRDIAASVPVHSEWLFVGCGTSYYLALSATASFSAITGKPAQAIPASEILLFPHIALAGRRGIIACEAALKVMESSCSYAQSFHSLEFRHGPKSIVSPRTLVGFFLSDSGYAAEVDLLEEVKDLGGITFVVTPKADIRVRAMADFLVEVPIDARVLADCRLHPLGTTARFLHRT